MPENLNRASGTIAQEHPQIITVWRMDLGLGQRMERLHLFAAIAHSKRRFGATIRGDRKRKPRYHGVVVIS